MPTDPIAFSHSPFLIHGDLRALLPGIECHPNDGYLIRIARSQPTGTREQMEAVTAAVLAAINGYAAAHAKGKVRP